MANPPLKRAEVLFFDDQLANIESCKLNGYPRSVHTPEGFATSELDKPKAINAAAKAPTSFTTVSKVSALFRMPMAALADSRVAAAHRRRDREVALVR